MPALPLCSQLQPCLYDRRQAPKLPKPAILPLFIAVEEGTEDLEYAGQPVYH